MSYLKTILDFIFPVNCLICHKSGTEICFKCLSQSKNAVRECPRWIFPIFDYRHPPVKKAMWMLKYKHKKRISSIFGQAIYEKMLEELPELAQFENFENPILIPVPLSKKRLRERGFNQTALIIKEIEKINKNRKALNFETNLNILQKIKETEHQARIKDRSERLKNLKGTFIVNNKYNIKGKNIVLVDDVITTGATLSEAKKVLIEAGARRIYAFTIAH